MYTLQYTMQQELVHVSTVLDILTDHHLAYRSLVTPIQDVVHHLLTAQAIITIAVMDVQMDINKI